MVIAADGDGWVRATLTLGMAAVCPDQANRLGGRLRTEFVLYAGGQQLSFYGRLAVLPMAAL